MPLKSKEQEFSTIIEAKLQDESATHKMVSDIFSIFFLHMLYQRYWVTLKL